MIRLNILIFILLAAAGSLSAQDLVARADSAYNAEKYADAVGLYTQAIVSMGASLPLYFNLGNAYYRTGRLGKAIVCYERARRIDPSNSDVCATLDFVNSKVVDRPGERGTLFGRFIDNVSDWMSPNGWAWTAFVLLLVTIAGAGVYFFSEVVIVKKIGFFGGIVMLIITIFGVCIAFNAATLATATDEAVVTATSTILSNEPRPPRNQGEEAMLLHEGTKVTVLDSATVEADTVPQVWLDVQVDNSRRAWILATDTDRI